MITIQDPKAPGVAAPQVVPWAPSTLPVASVNVVVQRDESTGRALIHLVPLDAKGARIPFDNAGVPQQEVTDAQVAAFLAMPSLQGDTFDGDLGRRALPIVQTCLGLSGFVSPAPARTSTSARLDEARAKVAEARAKIAQAP